MLILQFPTAAASGCFDPYELKRIFYMPMPKRWRTNLINSGQSLQTTSTEALRTNMVQQESQTDAHRRKTRYGNKKAQSKQPFKFNRNKKSSKKSLMMFNLPQEKTDQRKRNFQMMTTAPFMAQATNGGSAIKINMAKKHRLMNIHRDK